VGTTTVNWSVTDIHGNTGTAVQTVTVTDNQAPVISVSNVSVNNDAGNCSAAVTLSATATDNCAVTATPTNDWGGGPFPVGTTTVNWSVTDIHGNTGTAIQTVTVTDNQAPVISVSNVSVNNDAGNCSAAVTLSATATDNCGVTATPTNDWGGGPFPVGTTTVNWSVTDIHGNTGTAVQTVTVSDNQAPVISVSNVSVNNDAGNCSAAVTLSATATDNCGVTATPTNDWGGGPFPVGTTTVNWSVTDIHGNTGTAVQTVTVTDNQAPVISVSNVSVNNDAGNCSAAVTLSATATDNCGVTATPTNDWGGGPFPVGTTTVNWSVTDIHGNTGTAVQTVTVTDNQAPVISVSNVSVNNDAGNCSAAVTLSATATDNCGVTATPTNDWGGGPFPVGTTTVNWSVTDIHGNTGTAIQTVTVTDNQAPVISVSNVSVNNDAGNCSAAVTLSATATDNCGVTATPTNDWGGGPFPVGTTTVNWSVTDIHGNTGTAVQTVTVTDNQAPVISVSNVSVNNDAGNCSAAVTLSATATDNCGVTATPTNDWGGGPFPVGTTTVNWSVTDIHGNTGTAIQTVTVTDNQAPVISVSNVSVNNDAGNCSAAVTLSATATDNCGVTATPTNDWGGGPFPVGTTTVNWSVTDIHGNTGTAVQTVTVADNQAPVISVSNVSVNNDAGNCSAAVTLSATATDNCAVTATPTNDWGGGPFPVGTTTVNWSVTDIHGNTGTAVQTVTVTDNQAPVISVSNVSVNNDLGNCSAAVTLSATATDNCAVTATPTNDWGGGPFPVGTTTVNWSVTDIHGNTGTAVQTVTVTDNQAPTITAPSNVTINGWCHSVSLATAGASLGTPVTADNCSVAGVTNDAPALFPVGATTVTWTVTDIHGNTATATQTVSVNPATISFSATGTNVSCNTANAGNHSNGSITTTVGGGTSPYSYSWTGGASGANPGGLAIGSYSVTITDAHSCTKTGSASVGQPTAITYSSVTATNVSCNSSNGGTHNNGTATVNSATGGAGSFTYLWSNGATTNPATGLTGTATYSVTIKDANSCTTTGSATVSQPTAITYSSVTATNVSCNSSNGGTHNNGTATVNSPTGGAGSYTYLWSNSATTNPATGLTGAATYSVTIKDANSCTTTGSATVGQPTAITYSSVTATNVSCNSSNGGTHNNGTATVNSATGGAGSFTYLWSNGATTNPATGLTGTATYSVTIKDANSCTTTGSATVSQPTAITYSSVTATNVSCNSGNGGTHNNGSATVNSPTGGAGSYTYLWSNGATTNPATSLTGTTTYSVTIKDANNCTATGSATVGQPTVITFSVTVTQPTCATSTGSVSLSSSGGTGAITYSGSATTSLTAGTYDYTATDTHGCTATATATITAPAGLTVSGTVTDVSCRGGSTGSIVSSVTGGTPSYSYLWSPGSAVTSSISGKAAGTYSVTVTDAHGCTGVHTYTISQPATALTVSASVTNESCYRCCNGSINTTVSGGTATYTYDWSNGSHVADPSSLCANTYTVTVTDAHSCTTTGSYTVHRFSGGRSSGTTAASDGTSDALKIYPNPTENVFNLEIPAVHQSAQVVITDLMGQIVESRDIPENNGEPIQFSLASVPRGIYLVKVFADGTSYTGKVIAK